MQSKTRNVIIAVLVILVMVVAAYVWYRRKHTATVSLSSLVISQDNAVTFSGPYTSGDKNAASKTWIGKKVKLNTKSLGNISSTVTAQSLANGVATLTTAPKAYTGTAAAVLDSGDKAYVYLV